MTMNIRTPIKSDFSVEDSVLYWLISRSTLQVRLCSCHWIYVSSIAQCNGEAYLLSENYFMRCRRTSPVFKHMYTQVSDSVCVMIVLTIESGVTATGELKNDVMHWNVKSATT